MHIQIKLIDINNITDLIHGNKNAEKYKYKVNKTEKQRSRNIALKYVEKQKYEVEI